MSQMADRLSQVFHLPPKVVAKKVMALVGRKMAARRARKVDCVRSSFGNQPDGPQAIQRYFSAPDVTELEPLADQIRTASRQILDHRFDLLGSGPVSLNFGAQAPGLEGTHYPGKPYVGAGAFNPANRNDVERIVSLLAKGYSPIDWHRDFVSGYRWPENTWYQDIKYGHLPGVDIKAPWELARFQHLPVLVWAYRLADQHERGAAEQYRSEFRDQILDFIAHNPPRFGVNWRCTMDVGIRVANWLVARDLFVSAGAAFDDEFESVFARSVLEHARHIHGNLEWDPDFRANHYLANIVGLLYAAAYLPRYEETDGWLAFAVQELHSEVLRQFGPDGAGFEASTAYHGLSAEMALYATALVLDLGERNTFQFSDSYFSRLAGAAQFTRDVTKPNGRIAQIGDNDSGRFLKLFGDDPLDHRHLLAAFDGLVGGIARSPESAIVAGLAGGRKIAARVDRPTLHLSNEGVPPGRVLLDVEFAPPGEGLTQDLRLAAYPDFGLYIWRSGRLFLSVRCGPIGLNGRGAHAHNDQLAVELNIDGEDWIADPGSYLYTPLPERRDEYRSVNAHFAPRLGDKEPGNLKLGPFWLGDEAKAEALRFDPSGFVGRHYGFGVPVYREVSLTARAIRVRDVISDSGADAEKIVVRNADEVRSALGLDVPFSPGYGLRCMDQMP